MFGAVLKYFSGACHLPYYLSVCLNKVRAVLGPSLLYFRALLGRFSCVFFFRND